MDFQERTSARKNTYQLFSSLFLDGITPSNLPYLSSIPEFGRLHQEFVDPDETAAEYYRVFSQEIFPYESMFRDPSGLLGGAIAAQTQHYYQEFGFPVIKDGDHIGHELAFLAFLCDLELRNHQPSYTDSIKSGLCSFLREHLLAWLPAFSLALKYAGNDYYCELGLLTMTVIDDHLTDLEGLNDFGEISIENGKPPNPDDQSVKQIVNYLISPVSSGIYLNRSQIKKIARRHKLPLGFGNRFQMLLNLFRSAGLYGATKALIDDLLQTTRQWIEGYQSQANAYTNLSAWIKVWELKSLATKRLLIGMSNTSE